MDKCIGDFFKILKEMNLYDNSLIIITADHGEEFQEHGYMLHENPYYFEEQVHVPLILKMPKKSSALKTFNRRIKGLVEVIDIMPSILDYLNIPYIKLQGKSFQNLLNSDANGKDYVFGFGYKQLSTRPEKIATTKQKKWLMVRSKRWKLISDDGLKEERFKLFDLENDPEERENLAIKRPDIKNRLLKKIKEKIEESKKLRTELLGSAFSLFNKSQKDTPRKALFTEEETEQLKALGYVE
jgi:arylsulfatase A-like enzyme